MPRSERVRPTHLTIDGQAVEIRRSARRTRTVQARLEGDVVVVMTPARMSAREEAKAVEDLVRRVTRKSRSARNDDALMSRALRLSRAHLPGAPRPSSVRWVSNMTTRWASCTPGDASIRVSDALIGMPDYVVDAVLLHELAHLIERGHGPRFQALIRVYPHHERAEAYLAGASFGARRPGALPSSPSVDGEDESSGGEADEADSTFVRDSSIA